MEQTPPPLVPSNEPARRRPPWLIPLIVIGALLFLGCAGLVGGGFFLVKNLKAPEARAGYGHPTVAQKLPDGWVKVRFPEVPMTLDLPDEPTGESMDFGKEDGLAIESWMFYSVETDSTKCVILGLWLNPVGKLSLEDFDDYCRTFLEEEEVQTPVALDARNASERRFEGSLKEGPVVCASFLRRGSFAFVVQVFFEEEGRKEATEQLNRICKSEAFEE